MQQVLIRLLLGRQRHRLSWTGEKRETAGNLFKEEIKKQTFPSLRKCAEAIIKHRELKCRTALQLKAWVCNQIAKNKRIREQEEQKKYRKLEIQKIKKCNRI